MVLNESPEMGVSLIGHTDNDGEDDLNLQLPTDRAEAVKVLLSSEFEIDGSRLKADDKRGK